MIGGWNQEKSARHRKRIEAKDPSLEARKECPKGEVYGGLT
jgi:hypothetical protein